MAPEIPPFVPMTSLPSIQNSTDADADIIEPTVTAIMFGKFRRVTTPLTGKPEEPINGERSPHFPAAVFAATLDSQCTPSFSCQLDPPTIEFPSDVSTKIVYLLNKPPPSRSTGPAISTLNIPLSVRCSMSAGVLGIEGTVGLDVYIFRGGWLNILSPANVCTDARK